MDVKSQPNIHYRSKVWGLKLDSWSLDSYHEEIINKLSICNFIQDWSIDVENSALSSQELLYLKIF